MASYYNENDPKAAAQIRRLIRQGRIAPGDVDERSIRDVKPNDLDGYSQCHFFAGIGGWSLALRLAGVPDDCRIWTGSCPCQPFSSANQSKRKGMSDHRHLWPIWRPLIPKHRPAGIFGEQVKTAIADGWLDLVADDLEAEDYAFGSTVLPACSVGAPHQRDRIYWFAADNREPQQWREHTNRGRVERSEEVESLASYSHETGRANGFMESGLRETQVSLDRCFVGQDWETWRGGFGGFGRVDDGISRGLAKHAVGAFGNAIVPQVAAEFIRACLA